MTMKQHLDGAFNQECPHKAKDMLLFQYATSQLIRIYAPKKYHDAEEWEYEPKDAKECFMLLRVWLDDDRADEPFLISLTDEQSDTMTRIWNDCKHLMIPYTVEEMD